MWGWLQRLLAVPQTEQCPGRWYYTSGGCDGIWSCTGCTASSYGFGNDCHPPGPHVRAVEVAHVAH